VDTFSGGFNPPSRGTLGVPREPTTQDGLEVDVVSVRQPQQEEQHVRTLVLDRLPTVGVGEQRHLLVGLEEAELLQQLGRLRHDADRERLGGVVAVPLTGRTERPDRSM